MPAPVGIVSSSFSPTTANTWLYQAASTSSNWVDVEWTGTNFIAISAYLTPRLMTSPDGVTWTSSSGLNSPSGGSNACIHVNPNNSALVHAATRNSVYISTDSGSTWSLMTSSLANLEQPKKIVSSQGSAVMFLVGRNMSSTPCLFRSTDNGVSWIQDYQPPMNSGGFSSNGTVLVDADLNWRNTTFEASWNSPTFTNGPGYGTASSIHYAAGRFVAVGYDQYTYTSYDGKIWTQGVGVSPGSGSWWTDVTYGDGLWVAVAYNGKIMTSTNGLTWTESSTTETPVFESVIFGNGKFVAVASSGTNQVAVSDDENIPALAFNGGTIQTKGGYRIHRFKSTGSSILTHINGSNTVNYVVVGGGGSGAKSYTDTGVGAGGGGAGGVRTGTIPLSSSQAITVGGGGQAIAAGSFSSSGNNGSPSSIGSLVSCSGGGGGGSGAIGKSGGSGGGGGTPSSGTTVGGSGTTGEGFAGGGGITLGPNAGGGGGGGASAVGSSLSGSGGKGGDGLAVSVAEVIETFGGGGGGAGYLGQGGGGTGGGGAAGRATTAVAVGGTANTGGGGGAYMRGSTRPSGAGGSGVVIIWYAF